MPALFQGRALPSVTKSGPFSAAQPEGQALLDSESDSAAAHTAVGGDCSSKSRCRAQLQDRQPTALIEELLRQQLVFRSDERCQGFEGIGSLFSPL